MKPKSTAISDDSIDAMPTKELFIDMLTKDIQLIPSIVDLVDNSTDGAQRIRGDKNFKGLEIRISASNKEFRIADNCGGMASRIAKEYAFRFGRPKGAKEVKHSVGQFGVGMKRALFKIGKSIKVESKTDNERFTVHIDVDHWAARKEWQFHFSELDENYKPKADEERGTIISVTNLRPGVADEFSLKSFQSNLRDELQRRIVDPLTRGLAISINGIPIDVDPLRMLSADKIEPVMWQSTYKMSDGKPVKVKIFCGLGDSREREAAGWHVFCNGRLILFGDKGRDTGWGERAGEVSIPGFHGQYNHFRGYVFLDCDNSGNLPWNTTKTGINADSELWRSVRLEMRRLMLPVKNFLDALKAEKEDAERNNTDTKGPLESLLLAGEDEVIHQIKTRDVFTTPPTKPPKGKSPNMANILYSKPLKDVKAVMNALGASSYKQVGEMTFDYYFQAEVNHE